MRICGPKYALFVLILSAWGIFQLLLLDIYFYFNNVALIEDLPVQAQIFVEPTDLYTVEGRGYKQNVYNCWIATCIYVLAFLISGHQFYLNYRSSSSV